MNISELTLARLNKKEKKTQEAKGQIELEEPVKDVKDFFKDSIKSFDTIALSSEDQYEKFLSENEPEEPKTAEIYGTIDLSDLFRRCSNELADEQKQAFHGIETVRAYLETVNCNCAAKKAKMEEYYRDFVAGNIENDLFKIIKEKLKLEKITFFYESQIFLEI